MSARWCADPPSVDPVVFFAQPHPEETDRVFRTRLDGRLLIFIRYIPKQTGVVVEDGISQDILNFPLTER